MFTGTFQATQDRWSDAQEGTPLALSRWLEQVTEEPEHGGLFSRLPQRVRSRAGALRCSMYASRARAS
jgi:hypothetical protein